MTVFGGPDPTRPDRVCRREGPATRCSIFAFLPERRRNPRQCVLVRNASLYSTFRRRRAVLQPVRASTINSLVRKVLTERKEPQLIFGKS